MKAILAGHDVIEFGWCVATWIPAVRHKARKYEQVVIVCKPSHRYLYQDFATDFINFDKKGRTGLYGWYFRDKQIKMPLRFKTAHPDSKTYVPSKYMCTKAKRKYFKYGTFDEVLKYDIVIHARSEAKFGRGNRNWSPARYGRLLKKLRLDKELSVCSIGTFAGAYHIKGTEDKRDIEMEELCNLLASSRLCIGVSSGPMHLASLCGCPHVVWTDNKYQKSIKGTNRDRYGTKWNPFNTEVQVIDNEGWTPRVDTVYEVVKGMV